MGTFQDHNLLFFYFTFFYLEETLGTNRNKNLNRKTQICRKVEGKRNKECGMTNISKNRMGCKTKNLALTKKKPWSAILRNNYLWWWHRAAAKTWLLHFEKLNRWLCCRVVGITSLVPALSARVFNFSRIVPGGSMGERNWDCKAFWGSWESGTVPQTCTLSGETRIAKFGIGSLNLQLDEWQSVIEKCNWAWIVSSHLVCFRWPQSRRWCWSRSDCTKVKSQEERTGGWANEMSGMRINKLLQI